MPDTPEWLNNIIGGVGQGLNNATTSPMLAPALATAYQYYQNADKYGNMAGNFAKEANPFGDRSQYVQGLSDLYNDPSSIENSAAYQFRLNQGLNTLGPQQAAKGAGYGNAARAMMDYASGLASTEYDKEWARRYEAAGGKFDPANSVNAQLAAYKLETDARNAALGALFTPFAPQPGGTTINNNSGGGSNGLPGFKPSDLSNGVLNGTNYGSTISAIYGGGQGALQAINSAMAAGAKFIDLGNGQMIDLAAAARAMGGVDSPGNFGTYPTDGSIGNYGPETPIETPIDPYVPIQDPGGFTPTTPMPDDYLYDGLDLSFNDFG